jgi:hypothetical protein
MQKERRSVQGSTPSGTHVCVGWLGKTPRSTTSKLECARTGTGTHELKQTKNLLEISIGQKVYKAKPKNKKVTGVLTRFLRKGVNSRRFSMLQFWS